MATILTVHGTNSSGPAEGQHWWQRGSPFEQHLHELVEGEDGRLEQVPLIWDGANSELSRQAAGAELLRKMTELESRGEPYCVIGHSHGGSIAAGALIAASHRRRPLSLLSRWITVGTPFIASRRKRFLYSRLGFFGKATYLAVLTYAIGLVYFFSLFTPADASKPWAKGGAVVVYLLMFSLPALVCYGLLRWLSRNKLPWHSVRTRTAAGQHYGTKWLSLWHEDDEAICGLASLKRMSFPFFDRDFAVPAVSLLATLAVPILATLMLWNFKPPLPSQVQNPPAAVSEQGQSAPQSASPAPAQPAPAPDQKVLSDEQVAWIGVAVLVAMFLLLPALAAGFAVLILLFFRMVARPTSAWVSRYLNSLTWSQVRRSALGNDAEGQVALDAGACPMWLSHSFPSLPAALSSEISRYSDAAAANSLAKFRSALSNAALVDSSRDQSDLFLEYLTWDELIHTAYFKVPRFRKLLAYAIAQSEGFRATAAFQRDPDFALVKSWYDDLQGAYLQPHRPVTATPSGAALPAAAPAG